jgi:tRNA-dihydrouridine synthase B
VVALGDHNPSHHSGYNKNMKFNWKTIKKPYVMLAPMAGYTDSAFRRIVKGIAPNVICVTELISVDGLAYETKKTLEMLRFHKSEQPNILQLFGKKLEHFKEAVKMAEDLGFSGVDINMGCPARKVVNSMHGSALIKTPDLAFKIVETCVKNTKLPVSVKTRLGWSDDSGLLEFTKGLENAGAQMITIHGRTSRQWFSGIADWKPIYEVKKHLKIPVTGNGDIFTVEDALKKIDGLDGIMVGRGAVGNPWLLGEISVALKANGRKKIIPRPESFDGMKKTIMDHARFNVELYGEDRGVREMRKIFGMYIKGFPGAAKFRSKLVLVNTLKEAKDILDEI